MSSLVSVRMSYVMRALSGTVFVAPESAWNCVAFIDQMARGSSQID